MDTAQEPLLKHEKTTVYDSIYPYPEVTINADGIPDVTVARERDDIVKSRETKLYKRRWYILFVFSMIAFVQGGIWNTWGPIAAASEEAFGWTDADIALYANWGPIAYLVATFPFAWLIDVKGMYIAYLVATFPFAWLIDVKGMYIAYLVATFPFAWLIDVKDMYIAYLVATFPFAWLIDVKCMYS